MSTPQTYFRATGTYKITGRKTSLFIPADTEEAALERAAVEGISVESIQPEQPEYPRWYQYSAVALIAILLVAADEKSPKAKEPAPSAALIQQWIKQLGDESFKVREEATRDLIKAGWAAFDAVTKATKSEDAEVKQRALSIIKHIKKEKKKAGAITPAGKAAAKTKVPGKNAENVDPFADDL